MAKLGKVSKAVARVSGTAKGAAKGAATKVGAPSPNPMTNIILADVALRVGGQILRHGVERGLLGQAMGKGKAKKIVKGRSMTQTLLSTAVARIATRSVPGAIIVGGGMLAKTLYDRRRAREAEAEGTEAVEKQIEKGK